jgi:hypothetical protein
MMYLPITCSTFCTSRQRSGSLFFNQIKCSADVGRTVLGVVHDDRLFAPSWHEDFRCSVAVQLRCAVWTGVTRDTRPNCDIGQALNPWVAVC